MHCSLFRATVCLLICIYSQLVISADKSTLSLETNKWHIEAVTEVIAPFQFYDDKGKLVGFSVDVVKELAKRSNINITISVYPWLRTYQYALKKPNVLIFSMSRIAERESSFHWIGNLVDSQAAFITLTSDQTHYKNMEQFRALAVGVNRGYPYDLFLTSKNFNNIERLHNNDLLIQMLFEGRIDAILGTINTTRYQAKQLGFDPKKLKLALPMAHIDSSSYLALNKHSDIELVNKLKRTLHQMQIDGSIKAIQTKWGVW